MKQIAPQARFFWLNPDVYKIFLTESWTNCISLRERWNKVRALRNHSETRWSKVRALRNHSEEGVGCRQPTEPKWTVITFTVWAVAVGIININIKVAHHTCEWVMSYIWTLYDTCEAMTPTIPAVGRVYLYTNRIFIYRPEVNTSFLAVGSTYEYIYIYRLQGHPWT